MTQRESIVLEVRVEHEGEVYTACYFVEHGVIHAKVGDRFWVSPLLDRDAAETVKSFVLGHVGPQEVRSDQREQV